MSPFDAPPRPGAAGAGVPPQTGRPGPVPRVASPALADVLAEPSRAHRDALMRRVAQEGTPLVDAADDPAFRVYTFVHAGAPGTRAVLLDVNKLVDAGTHRQALMEQVPGTTLWALALRMPAGWRATYGLAVDDGTVPLVLGQDADAAARLAGLEHRRARAKAAADPDRHADLDAWYDLLRRSGPDPLARDEALLAAETSVVVGPHAPRLPGPLADEDPDAALAAHGSPLGAGGRGRLVPVSAGLPDGVEAWWHMPSVAPGPGGYDVLVLLDGGPWRTRGLRVLDRMSTTGLLRPTVTLLVQHADAAARSRDLTCSPEFVRALVALVDEAGDAVGAPVARDPRRTTIAGQSLGGLTALYAQCVAPGWFGASVCQSGSWWWPSGDEAGWLERAVAEAAADPAWRLGRVHLEVGTQEWVLLDRTRRLRDLLAERCERLGYREVAGGHDAAWWAATLPEALASVTAR
ncbi:enterochelin esterase domain-containing protein [Puerhibacterium puerhi]|uniref:enterochelin esterase domain-containing protein n=1 Tax=Puerhibacterium puerhi TaxID=2692623 RepID=UPI00135C80A2|nr:alpha/beta hydrolase-fold protein [Puerhibacterium puerhi]